MSVTVAVAMAVAIAVTTAVISVRTISLSMSVCTVSGRTLKAAHVIFFSIKLYISSYLNSIKAHREIKHKRTPFHLFSFSNIIPQAINKEISHPCEIIDVPETDLLRLECY